MIKNDLLDLDFILNELKTKGKTKFRYVMLKNLAIIEPLVKPIKQIDTETKQLLAEYEKQRNELIIKIGKKTSDDKVFIDVKDEEMLATFSEGMKKITEDNKEAIEKYESELESFKKILEEEVEEKIEFKEIDIENCPEEEINTEYLKILMKFNIIP